MRIIYPAYFCLEEDGQYSVIFPDFEGSTCGSNLTEAYEMAEDYLGSISCTLEADNEQLPKATDIKELKKDLYPNSFTTLISVELNDYKSNKSVKKTLTIPQWLNDKALENNINFSGVLQEALKQKLNL